MKSVNFASHQISEKTDEEKDIPKCEKKKKVFIIALGEAMNKVINCFFYERDGHLKKLHEV